MSDKIRLDFRVLIYRENDFWIAHCLETDLVAEGETVAQAIDSLIDISNVQIQAALEEGDLASIFSPAPADVWRMYAVAGEGPSRRPRKAIKQVDKISVRQLATA
jgi:predicted RNase H-like HicB family nuclease